jgi:hypothetical protein
MRKKLDELKKIATSYNISVTGKKKQELCNEILARLPIVPIVSGIQKQDKSVECEEWFKNPGINPKTKKAIKIGGPTYKKLEIECSQPREPTPVTSDSRPKTKFTKADLAKMKKNELISTAVNMGLRPGKLLKSELIDFILNPSPPKRSLSPRPHVYTKTDLKKKKKSELIEIATILGIQTKGVLKSELENLIFSHKQRPSPVRTPPLSASTPEVVIPKKGVSSEAVLSEKNTSSLVSDFGDIPPLKIIEFKKLNYLAKHNGFKMINVPLDGNCMFSVIGRAFNVTAAIIRKHTVDYLRRCKGSFDHIPADIIDSKSINWNDYIDRLEENACWGDNVALFAASLALNFQAHILQVAGGNEGSWIKIGLNENNIHRIIYMGYIDNFHYLSLEPISGRLDILEIPKYHQPCPPPSSDSKKLKPSIPHPSKSLRSGIASVSKLQPSIPRSNIIPGNVPLARLETLTKIKDIIDALQKPLEHKLSTLTNTEKAIMQCIGVA